MKNKITLVSAFLAASSLATAEIVINDFLSFEGFIDMSYSHTDTDSYGSNNSYGLDQVEIDWLFNFDHVSGLVDFAYYGSDASNSAVNSDDDTQLEQAYVAYSFDDGTAITAGRFESILGFEAFEPTGLYQYSFAYDFNILPGYSEGVRYSYEDGDVFFCASLLSGYGDGEGRLGRLGGSNHAIPREEDGENPLDSNYAIELAGSYVMDDLTLFLGGYFEENKANSTSQRDGNTYLINAYATFETGAWLFAGEVNFGDSETGVFNIDPVNDGTANLVGRGNITGSDVDALSALIMANFAYCDEASITGRISYEKLDFTTATLPDTDVSSFKYTLAHGYAFTDNLFLVTEVSYTLAEVDVSGLADVDTDSFEAAVELLFAF